MRLTYSILWFDDDEEYLESIDQDYIEEEFAKWGFNCDLTLVHDIQEFNRAAPFQDYDLILVDYSLDGAEEGLFGQSFIKQVREQQVLTEVIFYSSHAVSNLWEAIRSEMLEGVFVASRNSGVDNKLLKVAKQSIHKVLDLENMRGIVMAEVGTIDEVLTQIAMSQYQTLNQEHKQEILNKYAAKVEKQQNNTCQQLQASISDDNVAGVLALLDSEKKWNFCQSLSKKLSGLNINAQGNYSDEILKTRNFLAHGVPEKQQDGSLKFHFKEQEYIFNQASSEQLRLKLRAYSSFFESILE